MKGNQLQEILRTAFDELKNGKTTEERIEAASTIWNISISDPDVLSNHIDFLGGYLSDPVPGVRGLIAWTLYTLAMKYPENLLPLLDEIGQALLDSDLNVRRYAANILVELSREWAEHLYVLTPTLIKASEDPSVDVRIAVEKIQQNILAGKKRSAPPVDMKVKKPSLIKETVSEISAPKSITDEISISQRINVLKNMVSYCLSLCNDSPSDISEVVAVIVSHPSNLKPEQPLMQQRTHVVSKTIANFEFSFKSMQDFLEGSFFSTISFLDPKNTIHTISSKPYHVQLVYPFLRKLNKPLEFFEQYKTKNEHGCHIELYIHAHHNVGEDMFSRIKQVLDSLNIQVVHEESEIISDFFTGTIKGLSTGTIHRQIYATQLNILGPLTDQENAKYFALKFNVVGPDERMRNIINSDIKNEIERYMQFVEDNEPSESERKELDIEQLKSGKSLLNNRLESKNCINCGHLLPRNAKYCNDCGELQYRSF
ncbi:MAG: hypothetical protein ACFFCD_10175 [Promethearchaeota archaeon]